MPNKTNHPSISTLKPTLKFKDTMDEIEDQGKCFSNYDEPLLEVFF
jgi:hypothetical protein